MIWRLKLFEYFLHDLSYFQIVKAEGRLTKIPKNYKRIISGLIRVFSTNFTLSTADFSLFSGGSLTFVKINRIYSMQIMLRLCPFIKLLKNRDTKKWNLLNKRCYLRIVRNYSNKYFVQIIFTFFIKKDFV